MEQFLLFATGVFVCVGFIFVPIKAMTIVNSLNPTRNKTDKTKEIN